MGAGLLRHDQHGHLCARSLRAPPDSGRHAVRLLEGALPTPAGSRPPALRPRLRGLLAGHRQPRAIPAGELRRARRADRARHPGHTPAGKRLDRRGRRDRRSRGRRRAGVHRLELRRVTRGDDRRAHGARCERPPPRARARREVGDRPVDVRRPECERGGGDHREVLRRSARTSTSTTERPWATASRSARRRS